MPQQVIVTIDPDANVKIEAAGVTGSGCKAITEAIEKALGRTVADKTKPEFFQTAKQTVSAGR
jgi:hypothetical protein